jgi:GNAT superfamily N-acetyltransferase
MIWTREHFSITDDRSAIDMKSVADFLHTTYWAADRPDDQIERSWANSSLVFALRDGESLIGFARVISDLTIVGYLADVFVSEDYRRQGMGKWLIETILAHPDLEHVRWVLHTRDMHAFYAQFGFTPPRDIVMERSRTASTPSS